jgi:pimeloyl-ACP methyl ester carboxylesterase
MEVVYLEWIPPFPNESFESYSRRMAEGIDTSQPFIVLGVSMGGMTAVEIARWMQPVAVLLISSISAPSQLPPYYRWGGWIGIHRILPISFFKRLALWKRSVVKETSEIRKLLIQMIERSDPEFIRWSMAAILNWKPDHTPKPACHIHGTSDEILPIRYTTPTHRIRNGGHLMVMTRAKEISRILAEVLSGY